MLFAGDYPDGMALLEAVVESARESGDTFSLPMALSILGTELALHGDDGHGFAYLDEAATIARLGGLPRTSHLETALELKALVLLAWQDTAARPVLDELRGVAVGYCAVIFAFTGLALVDVLDGDLDTAEARLREARAIPAPHPAWQSFVDLVTAAIARGRGDLDGAAGILQEVLSHTQGADGINQSLRISALEMLAQVLLASGRTGDGVRLLAASHAARAHHGFAEAQPNKSLEQEPSRRYDRSLVPRKRTSAWAEGLAMTIADAVAFAQIPRE